MKRRAYQSQAGLSLLLGLLLLSALAQSAEARCNRVLVIQYGDSHSRYDRAIAFLALVRKAIAEFEAGCPGGQVVLIASGDISARSAFSFDKGWLNVRLLKHLSLRYPGVWVQGNHEALDWRGVEGRELYLQQMAYMTTPDMTWPFRKPPSEALPPLELRGITPVAANLHAAPAMMEYLRSYRDIPIHRGRKKLRIVGLTLENYFKRAVYDVALEPRLFRSVGNLEPETFEQLRSAAHDGIDQLIFAYHEEMVNVAPLASKIGAWCQRDALRRVKVPAIFAADDHLEYHEHIGGMHVFDSGCDYAMRAVEINRRGKVHKTRLFRPQDLTRAERSDLQNWLLPEDKEFIDEHARDTIRDAVQITQRKIGVLYGTEDTRKDFKRRRTELGTILADSFVLYAERIIVKEALQYRNLPVIGLLNSSTYRREDPIPYDELTVGDIASMLPYFQAPAIAVITGPEIQAKYAALRAYRKPHGVHTPQLSSNLRESPTAEDPYRLLYRVSRDKWVPVAELGRVVMIADHWLMGNGYDLPQWRDLGEVDGIKPRASKLEVDIVEENFGEAHRRYRLNGGHTDLYTGSQTCGGRLRLFMPSGLKLHSAS